MRTGILVALIGVFVIARSVTHDDTGRTLPDYILGKTPGTDDNSGTPTGLDDNSGTPTGLDDPAGTIDAIDAQVRAAEARQAGRARARNRRNIRARGAQHAGQGPAYTP